MNEPRNAIRRSVGDQVFRGVYAVSALIAVGLIVAVIALGVGLAHGYRPVVLTSGSMSPTAPTGSLIIAQPVDRVEVGDILVMSNEARSTITHRVIEIEQSANGQIFAVTQGDANEEVDAAPYPLDGTQMVGRWILADFGTALLMLGSPLVGLLVVGGAVLALTLSAISYIWSSSASSDGESSGAAPTAAGSSAGQKRFGMAVGLAVLFGFTGLAWSLYLGTDSVTDNAFSTADCFDARIGGVQSGQATSTSNGITSVSISAVDMSTSFVTYSVRSSDSVPGESVVLGDLSSSTTLDFLRQTSSGSPGPIVIEWSVIEYACGVTVQRGTFPGNGTGTIDVSVTPVDPSSSFLVGGSVPLPSHTAFDEDDQSIIELIGSDTVRFRLPSGINHVPGRTLGFQLVTFADPGDARNQVVSTTLGSGTSVTTIPLGSPVDRSSTMLITTASSPNLGAGVGDRAVRVRLLDASTVEVRRGISAGSVEVNVQVVEMLEGTTVQHGLVDLAATETSETIAINAVDPARTTVGSTVLIGGASSGGLTDEATSGEIGEATVTVALVDSTTVDIERTAADSAASFAWQAITWGGPSWADPDSPFRQRIDVEAGSVAAPNGYTTPVDIDHAALVASGLSLASGNDLRLWRFDGLGWTELDRVLDDSSTWNAASTRFWFQTQEAISAGSTVSYWLYFGDPTPTAPLADPTNVWLLDEGFESGLGGFEDRTEGTAWYQADPWTRRITLTIDAAAVPSTLSDQAVLVKVSDSDLAANAAVDGSDFVFVSTGGVTLPHDVASWNPGAGILTAWVRIPTVDGATDTTIFLYYGAPDAPRQAQPRVVWAGYRAVWNLDNDVFGVSPTLDDSGPQNTDGLALEDTVTVETPTGYGVRLDGTADRLESSAFRLSGGSFTASVLFRADSISGDVVLLAQGDPATTGVFDLGVEIAGATVTGSANLVLDGSVVQVSGGTVTAGAWHHLAVVWNQATLDLVLNGTVVASTSATGSLPSSREMPAVLGAAADGNRGLTGLIDQGLLRDGVISIDQLAFEATNLANPPTTVAAGSPAVGIYRGQGTWLTRRPIVVSSALADADVSDFPLLVELVDADLGASTQADGDDLVFTAADGTTRLDHFIERWDSSTGSLTAWVRLPLLSSTSDTEIFVYTDNAGAADQSDPIGVWGETSDLVLASP